MSISVVINTLNEAHNLPRALKSIVSWADEVVVVDMHSEDETVKIAKSSGAQVFSHERTGYVEPARNFAISKAKGEWILILDADEEATPDLKAELKKLASQEKVTFARIPRKNIIFGKWICHSRWWPDYNIRFFRKGYVTWDNAIHSIPLTQGEGIDLSAEESLALIHHHYQTIEQFIERMNRYTDQQVKMLKEKKYVWEWQDLIRKPVNEFLSRYFAGEGYKDGLHGLALAFLQATSEFVLYLKCWESKKFPTENLTIEDLETVIHQANKDYQWWFMDYYRNQGASAKVKFRKFKSWFA